MINKIQNIFKITDKDVLNKDFSKMNFIELNNFLAKLDEQEYIIKTKEVFEHFKKHIYSKKENAFLLYAYLYFNHDFSSYYDKEKLFDTRHNMHHEIYHIMYLDILHDSTIAVFRQTLEVYFELRHKLKNKLKEKYNLKDEDLLNYEINEKLIELDSEFEKINKVTEKVLEFEQKISIILYGEDELQKFPEINEKLNEIFPIYLELEKFINTINNYLKENNIKLENKINGFFLNS